MRRVSTPQSRARARRKAKALDRRQKRLSGRVRTRHVEHYGLGVTLFDPDDWNASVGRTQLGQPLCPGNCFAAICETFPISEESAEDGVTVVLYANAAMAKDELHEVLDALVEQVRHGMDRKHGPLGWLPARSDEWVVTRDLRSRS